MRRDFLVPISNKKKGFPCHVQTQVASVPNCFYYDNMFGSSFVRRIIGICRTRFKLDNKTNNQQWKHNLLQRQPRSSWNDPIYYHVD